MSVIEFVELWFENDLKNFYGCFIESLTVFACLSKQKGFFSTGKQSPNSENKSIVRCADHPETTYSLNSISGMLVNVAAATGLHLL